MNYQMRIEEIDKRARAIHLSLTAVSREAGLAPSMARRWLDGDVVPKVTTIEVALPKLETAIASLELKVLKRALPHHPELTTPARLAKMQDAAA